MQDVRYAPSKQVNPGVDFVNASTNERDKWRELEHAALAGLFSTGAALEPVLGHLNSDSADLPKLPGAANQTPGREQDQMFTALVDWVEQALPPASIIITSRDNSVSYPICVYPQRAQWDGSGSAKSASSYACR